MEENVVRSSVPTPCEFPPDVIDPRLLDVRHYQPYTTAASQDFRLFTIESDSFESESDDALRGLPPKRASQSHRAAAPALTGRSNTTNTTGKEDAIDQLPSATYQFHHMFGESEPPQDDGSIGHQAIALLHLCINKNKGALPSAKQLGAVNVLTDVSVERLSSWLDSQNNLFVENLTATHTQSRPPRNSGTEEEYRVRCLESSFRYRSQQAGGSDLKIFQCTNSCGGAFQRRRDWCRHEKLNFEEWTCPHCSKVLSRREKLQKHLKNSHPTESDSSKRQKRQFLAAKDRPCRFCSSTLTDWNAWLSHVGNHFEGHVDTVPQQIAEWKEHRNESRPDADVESTVQTQVIQCSGSSGSSGSGSHRVYRRLAFDFPAPAHMACTGPVGLALSRVSDEIDEDNRSWGYARKPIAIEGKVGHRKIPNQYCRDGKRRQDDNRHDSTDDMDELVDAYIGHQISQRTSMKRVPRLLSDDDSDSEAKT